MPKAAAKDYADMNLISPPHRLTSAEYEAGQAMLKQAFAAVDHADNKAQEDATEDAKEWSGMVAVEPSYSLNDVIVKLAWGVRQLGSAEAHSATDANPEAYKLMASALSDVILLRAASLARSQPVNDEGPL